MDKSHSFIKREIDSAIQDLDLNLDGKVVLTEAANGVYGFSVLIALLAGSKKVISFGKDSRFGYFRNIRDELIEKCKDFNLDTSLIMFEEKCNFVEYSEIDIVANLGHVRPIDKAMIDQLKPTSVISYMSEAWEFRGTDLDLSECSLKGIKVAGLNESHDKVNCFRETGVLAIKMLIDAGVSLYDNSFLIISTDKFGVAIKNTLNQFGINPVLISDFSRLSEKNFQGIHNIIVADFNSNTTIVGSNGIVSPEWLDKDSVIIQYCGTNNVDELHAMSKFVYPAVKLPPHKMAYTLADVSIKALVRLYAGGLKVGQLLASGETKGMWAELLEPMNFTI